MLLLRRAPLEQIHSGRIIGKKMGLTVASTKGEDRERAYSIKP